MLEKYEVVRAMFHGFDYSRALAGAPRERLLALGDAMEWILELQARDAARAAGEEVNSPLIKADGRA